MKLRDFKLKKDNHFVAMEYYWLIANRTYLIIAMDDVLVGIKVNGLISVESNGNMLEKSLVNSMAIKDDLSNPYSYIKSKYFDIAQDCDLLDGSILRLNKANFIIKRSDLRDAVYDPTRKWGMGYYPHDGKVYVTKANGSKREFIILGSQSGRDIAQMIMRN